MTSDSKDDRIRELEDEVRRLTVMLENAPDFITRITLEGKLLYLNRLAPGYEMQDVVGTSIEGYVPPEFHQRARDAMRAARELGTVQQYATLGRVSSDKIGYYLTRISPIVQDGEVTSLVLIATDVSELEEKRVLLQLALNATGLGIWTYEVPTGYGTWDETTRKIFGVEGEEESPHVTEMVGQRIHPEDRARVTDAMARAVTEGRYGPIEHRIVLESGELRWVAASGITLPDSEGRAARVVGSVMDVTHRRALEARLLEAQKLESIGRLAGGVAHDFNNMLTAILGNVDFASSLSSLDEVKPLLTEIRATAERSAALTAQLLAFARRQVIEPRVLEPNTQLRRLEPLLRRLLDERTNLTLELGASGRVLADPSQLDQVVLNLITNARDSVQQGGSVQLLTADVTVEQQPDLAPGHYVAITVRDDGSGIEPSALPQIFEPFFTTRSGGTGLGLATCYGIVKQSGGHIAVQSEVGQGASFTVYLPRVEEPASAPVEGSAPQPRVSGGERVLLVEDEAVVRSIIERTLARAHYRVSVATHGAEALEMVERDGPFDLLITDVVMPGMSGWELGRRLRERVPGLRVLYISGYTEELGQEGGPTLEGLSFLQKPFLPAVLLSTIRGLLDRDPG